MAFFEFSIEGMGRRFNVAELVESSESLRAVRMALQERYAHDPDWAPVAKERAHADAERYAIAGLEDLMRDFIPEKLHAIDLLMLTERDMTKLELDLGDTVDYQRFVVEVERIVKEQDRLIDILRNSTPKEYGDHVRAVHEKLLDELADRSKWNPPPETEKALKERLETVSRLHYPTDEEMDQDVKKMREGETRLGRPKLSTPSRQETRVNLRAGDDPKEVEKLIKKGRPPLEAYVHFRIFRANISAYLKLRGKVSAANPDVLVAVERGGWFLTDALTRYEPGLRGRVSEVKKLKDDSAHYAQIRDHIEALITNNNARRIAVADSYMGGRNAEKLINEVFLPLLDDHAANMSELRFDTYWLREAAGFELEGGVLRPPKYHATGPYAGRITAESVTVPWIFGDDLNVIMERAKEPIRIFNSNGDVIATIHPEPEETTWDLAVRVLNGKGLEKLSE